jgi:hypothetical protein
MTAFTADYWPKNRLLDLSSGVARAQKKDGRRTAVFFEIPNFFSRLSEQYTLTFGSPLPALSELVRFQAPLPQKDSLRPNKTSVNRTFTRFLTPI